MWEIRSAAERNHDTNVVQQQHVKLLFFWKEVWNVFFVSSKKTKKHHRISIQYLAKWCKMHWKQSGISRRIFPSLRIPRISDHLELSKLVAYHSTHWTLRLNRNLTFILADWWEKTTSLACSLCHHSHRFLDHFCNKFQLSSGDLQNNYCIKLSDRMLLFWSNGMEPIYLYRQIVVQHPSTFINIKL